MEITEEMTRRGEDGERGVRREDMKDGRRGEHTEWNGEGKSQQGEEAKSRIMRTKEASRRGIWRV